MDYYNKYLKYKAKYLKLKYQQAGGAKNKLKLYHIGNRELELSIKPVFNIEGATGAAFIDNDVMIITKIGQIFYITNYNVEPVINTVAAEMESNFIYDELEMGLMGIAVIKDKVYLSYTIDNGTKNGLSIVIDEFIFDTKYLKKTRNLLVVPFTTTIHHGGHLTVSPEGTIIAGFGDGGPQGDPEKHSQDLDLLLGKLVEIDPVSGSAKILARGLRQPWQFSFDSNDRIWIGDVGWNTCESVKVISDRSRQYNFGWNYMEGSVQHHKIPPGLKIDPAIYEYPTSDTTGRSIIGGFYIDKLKTYIFADWLGFLYAIKNINGKWTRIASNKVGDSIYAMIYDKQTIYVLGENRMYKLQITDLN